MYIETTEANMRKRGSSIRHRAKAAPGLIAQNMGPEYETRLRMSGEAFRGEWAQAAHFNDLADTDAAAERLGAPYNAGGK